MINMAGIYTHPLDSEISFFSFVFEE